MSSGLERSSWTQAWPLFLPLLVAACDSPLDRTDPAVVTSASRGIDAVASVERARSTTAATWLADVVPAAGVLAAGGEPGRADLDPDNDEIVGPPAPIKDCEALLDAAGVRFSAATLPVHEDRMGHVTCGAHQVVIYRSGPEGIRYAPSPLLTCGMALALARLEIVVQEEAQARFGSRVRRIEHGGTYSCRKMVRFRSMVSEHSYANAIDIRGFTLDDGRQISVLSHFGNTDSEPPAPRSQFLRTLARRLYDEAVFSVVLTPFFDRIHRDHVHVDLARYRVDGTR